MRAITQYLLNIQHIKTKAETDGKVDNWACEILSNNGLAGNYADRNYKILKAFRIYLYDEESGKTSTILKIPPPGQSKRKQRYYRQSHRQQYIMNFSPLGKAILPKHNALYLWDNPTPNSLNLYYACPKWCGTNYAEEYFIQQIPHPILTIKPSVSPEDIVEDIILPKVDLGLAPDLSKSDADIEDESEETKDETDGSNLREQN
jgi:hypothetical protein